MLKIFRDGDHDAAITTDATNESNFIDDFSALIQELCDKEGEYNFVADIKFNLDVYLPLLVDMCCAYRGYKNNVRKKQVFIAGATDPDTKYMQAELKDNK